MWTNIRRLIEYTGEKKAKYLFCLFIAIIIECLGSIASSYANKYIFNAIEYKDYELFKLGIIISISFIILDLVRYLMRYWAITETRYIVFKIKNKLFRKLTILNIDYFENNHSGSVLKKLNQDANGLKDLYFSNGYWVLRNLFNGVVSTILMLRFSWQLGLFSILFSIISVRISIKVNDVVFNKSKTIYGQITRLSEYLADILSGFLIIKIFDNNNYIRNKYTDENNKVYESTNDLTKFSAVKSSTMFLLTMLGSASVIFLGIILTMNDKLDYGTLMAVIALQNSVNGLFGSFSRELSTFTQRLTSAVKVFDFLEIEEVEVSKNEEVKPDFSNGIEFKDLSFGYKNRDKVLENFNISIKSGEKLMLCGSSGCGKSTILKLLLKFYEEYDGDIKVFGEDLKDYPLEQIRDLITYIPQNNFLFDATVKENIKFGNESATDEELKKACDDAYATEFIELMANGFDTMVEAGGSNVSGGQRQRLAIARAFIRNSPILLMDEPTSSLDSESEMKINMAMKKLMENKIVIMVTHKKTGVENFDRIIEMESIK